MFGWDDVAIGAAIYGKDAYNWIAGDDKKKKKPASQSEIQESASDYMEKYRAQQEAGRREKTEREGISRMTGYLDAAQGRQRESEASLAKERQFWENYRSQARPSIAEAMVKRQGNRFARQMMAAGASAGGGAANQLAGLREGMYAGERMYSDTLENAAIARIQEENARQAIAGQMIAGTYGLQNQMESVFGGQAIQGGMGIAGLMSGEAMGYSQLGQQADQFASNLAFQQWQSQWQRKQAQRDADTQLWAAGIGAASTAAAALIKAA